MFAPVANVVENRNSLFSCSDSNGETHPMHLFIGYRGFHIHFGNYAVYWTRSTRWPRFQNNRRKTQNV